MNDKSPFIDCSPEGNNCQNGRAKEVIRSTRSKQETYENFALKEPLLPPTGLTAVDLNGNNVVKSPPRRDRRRSSNQRAELPMNVLSNQNATLVDQQQHSQSRSPPLLSPRASASAAAAAAALNGGHSVLFRNSEPEEESTLVASSELCPVVANGDLRGSVAATRDLGARANGAVVLFTIDERPSTGVNTQLSTSSNSTRGAAAESFIGCNGGPDASAGAHSAGSSSSSSGSNSNSNSDTSNSVSRHLNNLNNSATHTEVYPNQHVSFQSEKIRGSTPKRSPAPSPDPLEQFRLRNSFSGL